MIYIQLYVTGKQDIIHISTEDRDRVRDLGVDVEGRKNGYRQMAWGLEEEDQTGSKR